MSEQPNEQAELSMDTGSPPKARKTAAKKAPAKKRASTAKKAAPKASEAEASSGKASVAKKAPAKKAATRNVAAKKATAGDELFPPAPEIAASVDAPKKRATKRATKKVAKPATSEAPPSTLEPREKPPVSEERAAEKPAQKESRDVPEGRTDREDRREDRRGAQRERSEAPRERRQRDDSRSSDRPERGEGRSQESRDRRRSSEGPDRADAGSQGNRESDRRGSDEPRDRDQDRDRRGDRDGDQRSRDGEGDFATRNRNRRKRWKDRKRDRRREFGPKPGGDESGSEEREPPPEVPLGPPEPSDGVLEVSAKGFGYLRRRELRYAQHPQDAYVPADTIRQYGLREGMRIEGEQCKGQRGPIVTTVKRVNGRAPEEIRNVPLFEELKAVNPNKRLQMETTPGRVTTRVIDMVTPIGRGQRGLIVAPPRAGKTTLLQHIAEAVVQNHPQMHLIILLVDERPEEVTEFKRILPQAELFASSNDMDVASHLRIAQFAIERAKRLVEMGEHVFILMDSITRMARAFNNASKKGATMSGGMGVGALEIPRRLFAAARNTRTAGSLTILATALVETGSRMDDLIFQEFKGTGNLELVLDRRIAEQFFYPAVDIFKSGTRREELLLQGFQLEKIRMLRRGLAGHKPIEALQRVLTLLERYPSNAQMLVELPSK